MLFVAASLSVGCDVDDHAAANSLLLADPPTHHHHPAGPAAAHCYALPPLAASISDPHLHHSLNYTTLQSLDPLSSSLIGDNNNNNYNSYSSGGAFYVDRYSHVQSPPPPKSRYARRWSWSRV